MIRSVILGFVQSKSTTESDQCLVVSRGFAGQLDALSVADSLQTRAVGADDHRHSVDRTQRAPYQMMASLVYKLGPHCDGAVDRPKLEQSYR